ncbi:hypothetical protein BC829DRAFT_407947 [Chytridium lagenaria]|nr:hypothetical protein BC829DRAFT_407947 [Chytridium lagenaria]
MPTHSPIPSLPSTSNTLHGLGTPQGVHPGPPAFSLSPSSSTSYMRGGTRSERLAGGVLRATAGLRDLPRPKEYADIVFLMDVTLSMDKYIENARETLINIMAKVGDQVPNFEPRVAFIGYRDYNDKDRFEMMDFTTNLTQLVDFIGKVKAKGGGDYPEDVKGGLCQVLKLDWKSRCKILLHVADAPPHGTRFHGGKYRDHFPDGGIAEKTFEEIFEFMTSHRIVYNFMRLNSSCDIMVREFNSIMGLFQGGKEIRVSELRTTDVVVFLEMMVKSISSSIRAR